MTRREINNSPQQMDFSVEAALAAPKVEPLTQVRICCHKMMAWLYHGQSEWSNLI
jgi:hypothetical protein